MGRSLSLGTIAGIRLQMHWTFLLLVGWVLLTNLLGGNTIFGSVLSVVFLLMLFGCVVLHELGHALAARMFGVPTEDITLLPIGGVARLQRIPKKPLQEIVIALAGPAVNVVIAAALYLLLAPAGGFSSVLSAPFAGGMLQQLLAVNIVLVAFNLLPAFPMDGGRVLRALLALVFDYGKATRIAATLGQVCAAGFALLGLTNPFLFLIAAFIFLGAAAEARQVSIQEQLGDHLVRDGMVRNFRVVPAYATLDSVADYVLDTHQQDFPVVDEGQLVGMLRRDDVLRALEEGQPVEVAQIMDREIHPVDESEELTSILEQTGNQGTGVLPVTKAGALTGLLDPRQMLQVVRGRAKLQGAAGPLPIKRTTPHFYS